MTSPHLTFDTRGTAYSPYEHRSGFPAMLREAMIALGYPQGPVYQFDRRWERDDWTYTVHVMALPHPHLSDAVEVTGSAIGRNADVLVDRLAYQVLTDICERYRPELDAHPAAWYPARTWYSSSLVARLQDLADSDPRLAASVRYAEALRELHDEVLMDESQIQCALDESRREQARLKAEVERLSGELMLKAHLQADVTRLTAELETQDETIADQARTLDAVILDRDTVLEQLEDAQDARAAAVQWGQELLAQRDQAHAARDEAIAARDATVGLLGQAQIVIEDLNAAIQGFMQDAPAAQAPPPAPMDVDEEEEDPSEYVSSLDSLGWDQQHHEASDAESSVNEAPSP